MDIIENARTVAERAHRGQFRRDGTTPYLSHPAGVAGFLNGESPEVIAAAWLHDVLEDTKETADTLRADGVGEEVIAAVEVLTKRRWIPYQEYLAAVKANPVARKVKVADMVHNLTDSPSERQKTKYARGLLFLAT